MSLRLPLPLFSLMASLALSFLAAPDARAGTYSVSYSVSYSGGQYTASEPVPYPQQQGSYSLTSDGGSSGAYGAHIGSMAFPHTSGTASSACQGPVTLTF